jgi:hypothetical protein
MFFALQNQIVQPPSCLDGIERDVGPRTQRHVGRRPRASRRCRWAPASHRASHAATDGSGWGGGGRGHGKMITASRCGRSHLLAPVTSTFVDTMVQRLQEGPPCRTSLRRARGSSFIIEWIQIAHRGRAEDQHKFLRSKRRQRLAHYLCQCSSRYKQLSVQFSSRHVGQTPNF